MVRGERPTMRGLIPVNGGEQRRAAEMYLRPNALTSLPSCPKRFTTISGQALTRIPSARLFCLLSGRTKRDQKWGRWSGFLRREGGSRGNNSFRSFPPSWRGESEGGQRLGWGTSGVAWLRSGTPARQQRGIQLSQRRRQPDSSLNCRGLAASSWCEGLECGRPRTGLPGPPRPYNVKVNSCYSTLSSRRSKYVTLSCLSARGKLIWVNTAETWPRRLMFRVGPLERQCSNKGAIW